MAINWGTSTAITISAGSLGSGNARSSAAITPGSANIAQIFVSVNILMTTTQTTGDQRIMVYGYMTEDGTTYTGQGASGPVDNVDGTDKTITLGSPTNLIPLGSISTTNATTADTLHQQFEVVSKFGGVPRGWGIVLWDDDGTAFGATVTASYTEVYYN